MQLGALKQSLTERTEKLRTLTEKLQKTEGGRVQVDSAN